MTNNLSKLHELVQTIKMGMLTTVDPVGELRSRPMAVQKHEDETALWFFTRASAPKALEVAAEQQVNVAFSEPKDQTYVSVSGRAALVRNPELAKKLWSPLLKAFFPKGLEDPDLALMKVSIEQAEYWDAPSGKMVQLFGIVKAALTGQPYQGEGSDHQKITV